MHPALHYELMQTWVADLQHQAPRDALACAAHHAHRAHKQRPGPRVPRPPRPAVPGRGCHRWAPRPMECPALPVSQHSREQRCCADFSHKRPVPATHAQPGNSASHKQPGPRTQTRDATTASPQQQDSS